LEFVAGNGREELWPQCYVVNVIVKNDLSQRPQRRECHLDGLALLAHLFIEFPRGVGLVGTLTELRPTEPRIFLTVA